MNVTTEQIDNLILAACGSRFSKVAMVIATIANDLDVSTDERNRGMDLIAERIEALVANGKLISQGDLKKWRFSEVRHP